MPNILIIEENPRVSELIAKFLAKKGMEADIAPDGISAIRSFVGRSYDLLLVNMELPFMAGDAVCRKIRENARGREIPIIMMSGELKNEATIEALKQELVLSSFLTKPFTSDVLYSQITACLPQAQPAEQTSSVPASTQQHAENPPPLKGALERIPFEQVLFYLMKKRGAGMLTVSTDSRERQFLFVEGAVVDISVSPEDEDFGDYLAAKRIAETAELHEYKEHRRRDRNDPRDLFVKMGCLTPEQFELENRNFVHERAIECFSWKSGSILFEWNPSAIKLFSSAVAFMPVLLYRGFKAHFSADNLRLFLDEKADLFVAGSGEFYDFQNHLSGEPGASEFLALIDGMKTCSEIRDSVERHEADVLLYTLDFLRVLTFSKSPEKSALTPPFPVREHVKVKPVKEAESFVDLGGELGALADEVAGIEFSKLQPAAAPESTAQSELEKDLKNKWEEIKDKNYYEMFGLTQKAFNFDKLKKAYFELTKKYGPQQFFASSGEVMSLAEEMLSKISNAYETLSNVVSKENYDDLLSSQEQAPTSADDKEFYEQIQFQSGKVFVEQGQYASAEKSFSNCVDINPEKPEYLAYLALAIYNNPASKGNPAAIKRAKDTVNKSLQLGKLSIAYALKGTMYFDEGGVNFAEAEFNKALRLNPNNKTALKKLEQIRAKREEEKKNIFQRMFS